MLFIQHSLICHSGPGVVGVRQVQVPHGALPGQDDHANHTTGATVPLDRLLQCTSHELDALFLRHLLFPVCVSITVDVG